MNGLRIILKRRIQIKSIFFAESVQNGPGKTALVRTGLPSHGGNGSLVDRQGLIRDQQILVELHLIAQAKAVRAGSEGIIERKAPRLHLIHTDAAVRAGEILAEIDHCPVHGIHHHQSSRQPQSRLDGIRQSFLDSVPDDQTVHHNFNIMLDILIQSDFLGKLIKVAVNAHADISALFRMIQHLCMLSFPAPDHGSQDLDPGPLRQRHDLIHHLIHSLPLDLPSAFGTVGNSDSGIEKSHIVIDFRHRPYCGSGIPVRGFLIDGNGRRKTFDVFHIRLFHLSQELPGVRGQRLHVPSLSFRIDRIKRQRRFSRTGKTG